MIKKLSHGRVVTLSLIYLEDTKYSAIYSLLQKRIKNCTCCFLTQQLGVKQVSCIAENVYHTKFKYSLRKKKIINLLNLILEKAIRANDD